MEEWWGADGWHSGEKEQQQLSTTACPKARPCVYRACPLSGVAQQAKQVPAYADDPNQRDRGGWADAGKTEKLQMQLYNKEKKGHARTIRLCVRTYGFPREPMSA